MEPIQRSAKVLAKGVRTGVLRSLKPSVRKISSKGVDELAAPIADECPGLGELVRVAEEEVAGCLGGPVAGRVGGDTGE